MISIDILSVHCSKINFQMSGERMIKHLPVSETFEGFIIEFVLIYISRVLCKEILFYGVMISLDYNIL